MKQAVEETIWLTPSLESRRVVAACRACPHVQEEQEQSQNTFKETAAIVQQLAGNIGNDVQRANFLAAAQMRQLVN